MNGRASTARKELRQSEVTFRRDETRV